MKYATVCSGVEACSVAWEPLGWEPMWFSEIERFPCQVLAHRYPNTPNLGDMTKIQNTNEYQKSIGSIDVFCGGTPCQSFSVAGLRKGLADPRGNLALVYLAHVERLRPRWVVWENVPGVLSSNGGRDFGAFVGALGQLGYGWAYRVLDAQYFGVPQRRRRVFVVGHIGGQWQRAAAVLFERESLRRNPAPGRKAGKKIASGAAIGIDEECNAKVEGFGTLVKGGQGGTRQAVYCIKGAAIGREPHNGPQHGEVRENQSYTLNCVDRHAIAFNGDQSAKARSMGTSKEQVLAFDEGQTPVINNNQVRRLTPRECERLQGFPDDWTKIPYRNKPASQCPDGPRYKAMGNSMAVPVMRWIAKRIEQVENIDI
jgi:DNA (cytosine-5)-methyltransferase 1